MRAMVEEQIEAESLPMFLSGRLYDDGVIDPRDTRTVLGICLSAIAHRARSRAPAASASSGCERSDDATSDHRESLVANRGEIARRVFRTCRDLGIATVAVYSDADAACPARRRGRRAVRLPGNAPAETYLRGELIAAARAAGADAVHPGYGFLSENAEFAAAVIDAGLTWIGPPAAAIEAMGSKIEAKKLMAAAGVPVLAELDPTPSPRISCPCWSRRRRAAAAAACGSSATGRAARRKSRPRAREAQSAFGDATVFCERYLATGRHVEVQVLADAHGTVWAVGERECSIQRRHQKVIEEAPSPLVERTPGMRAKLFDAAAAGRDRDRLRRRGHRRVPGRRARRRSSSWR